MTAEIKGKLAEKTAQIESRLRTMFVADSAYLELFFAASDHAFSAGGKRVRPVLTLLFADVFGNPSPETALNAAVAIELLHGYTLVHDDLPCMDNDTLRRGEPTVWARYGEDTAVLVGDYLQAKAFEQIAGCAASRELLPILVQAATRVIHGQVADIAAAKMAQTAWDAQLMTTIYSGKTCALIAAACQLGAVAAGASPEAVAAAHTYGDNLGMAFQLIDDVLDAGQAAEGNEFNALAVYGGDVGRVKAEAHAYTQRALAALAALPGDVSTLKAFAESLLCRLL